MSKFLRAFAVAGATLMLTAATAQADKLGLGREATPDEIAAWDIDIRPDGLGLPEGSGGVMDGEQIFTDNCAVCHGDFGEGVGRWPVLAGGQGTLSSARPVKTVGSYWPYLSTVYDYVRRAMPFGAARSLSDDDVYALTAYILYLNDIVTDEEFVLSNENFTDIQMPNEKNFFMDDREESPVFEKRDVCMTNCKETVEITAHAAVLDVTPDAEGGGQISLDGDSGSAASAKEVAAAPAAALDVELVAAGEKVFKRCKACHQVGEGAKHRTGPELNDVIGRVAGTADGFKYSSAMVKAGQGGLTWTAETLKQYLAKPKDMVKGTRMNFAGLRDEEDRAAIVEYLKSESAD